MAKKIIMDQGYDKEIAAVIKQGKKLDAEIAKAAAKKKKKPTTKKKK